MKCDTFGKSKSAQELDKILDRISIEPDGKKIVNKVCKYLTLSKKYCDEIEKCTFSTTNIFKYLYNKLRDDRLDVLNSLLLPSEVYNFTRNVVSGYMKETYEYKTRTTKFYIGKDKFGYTKRRNNERNFTET